MFGSKIENDQIEEFGTFEYLKGKFQEFSIHEKIYNKSCFFFLSRNK